MASEDLTKKIQAEDPQLLADINKYIDDLKNEAQGDFNFITKFLKKQFETALGNDDDARAEFFAKVANQAEKRMGRIPYDYEKLTGREKEDIDNFLKKKDMEDTEQRKEEVEFEKQQELAAEEEEKAITESANVRGMLDSGIEKRQKAEAVEKRKTNITDPQERVFAFRQALRDEQRRLGKLESGRNIEDITTRTRRTAEDTQTDFEKGTEGAQRRLDSALASIERTRRGELERGAELIEANKLDKAFRETYGV